MEDRFIAQIRAKIEAIPEGRDHLVLGIGDDAAILSPFEGNGVVTTDLLCDKVDFTVGVDSPRLIGRKALGVNLSDLAAMGAVPHSVVISVLLPDRWPDSFPGTAEDFLTGFREGLLPLARHFRTALAGGDTNRGPGVFAVSVTAFGTISDGKALLRSGARPGDRILVTGPVGGSIFHRHFLFTPRVAEALYLKTHYSIHAGMDISDGLLLDLSRMARESGVGFALIDDQVPIHPDALSPPKDSRRFPGWEEEKSALDHALGDGEDFELILAVPPEEAKRLLHDQPFAAGRPFSALGIDSFHDDPNYQPAILTEIGEFTPLEEGVTRQKKEGDRRVPIREFSGWNYRF